MSTLGDSPYQAKLLDTFWDMADIFFFKRKDGSEVEKLFVDYWFGVEFDDENTNTMSHDSSMMIPSNKNLI